MWLGLPKSCGRNISILMFSFEMMRFWRFIVLLFLYFLYEILLGSFLKDLMIFVVEIWFCSQEEDECFWL
jgi:hypothetical protein